VSSYSSSFVDLAKAALEMCAVKEGETVAVLTQGDDRQDYARTFMDAASRLGAIAYNVTLPEASSTLSGEHGAWTVGETPLARNRPVIDALKQADLMIDTLFLLFSKEQMEIQAAGTRILLCIEPLELLQRLFPQREIRERVEVGEELLNGAKALRFTNEAGTDVTYRLGVYPVVTQYGYTDTPGRWDHWPSGFVFTGGADDGVDGKVVVDRGDIIITPFKKFVADPVEITIEAGRVAHVRGSFDAELLRDYIAGFDDENAYGIAHIGWGCNEKARWSGLANDRRSIGMESRAFYGNTLFSTGPNQELGGSNGTACHIDIPMRNCNVYLDDEPVIIEGEFTIDELKAPRSAFAPPSLARSS
jgi:2,5-dihydroxypyridine 5,6-dioxygenase